MKKFIITLDSIHGTAIYCTNNLFCFDLGTDKYRMYKNDVTAINRAIALSRRYNAPGCTIRVYMVNADLTERSLVFTA